MGPYRLCTNVKALAVAVGNTNSHEPNTHPLIHPKKSSHADTLSLSNTLAHTRAHTHTHIHIHIHFHVNCSYKGVFGTPDRCDRVYLIDLDSANGTFVDGEKIVPYTFVELKSTSLVTLAGSSRGYRFLVNMDRDVETKQRLYDKLAMNETELTKATSTLQSKDENTVSHCITYSP